MAFFRIIKGNITAHEFHYFSGNSGRRLDQTLSPKMKNPIKADQSVETWVADLMSRNVFFLTPKDSVKNAVEVFKKENINHIPLVQNSKLMGIISDRDIMWLDSMEMGEYTELSQFMQNVLIVCDEDTALDHLARVFYEEKINAMPVIDNKQKLVGIITHRDILKWIFTD